MPFEGKKSFLELLHLPFLTSFFAESSNLTMMASKAGLRVFRGKILRPLCFKSHAFASSQKLQ